MRIETLTIEEIKTFNKFDPFGTLKKLVFPNYFAVAAYEKDEHFNEIPTGVIVACENDDDVCIDWFYVRGNYRKRGIGEALIKKVFDVAVELDKKQVFFKLKRAVGLAEKTDDLKSYLKHRMFTETNMKYFEYIIDLPGFTDNPVIAVDNRKTLKAKPLGVLKPAEVMKALKMLMGEKTASSLYNMGEYTPVFDAKLSSVLMFEEEACGLLLMKSTGNDCYPVFLYSESFQETSALMVCSGLLASLYMPEKSNIKILLSDKEIQSYLKKVFPDYRYEVELVMADMSSYTNDDAIDEDDSDDDYFDDDDFDFEDDDDDMNDEDDIEDIDDDDFEDDEDDDEFDFGDDLDDDEE